MALKIGIVGLPNVGKSTLFNALTRTKNAEAQNYPFCTIDPNVGIVEVPDHRMDELARVSKAEKVIPAVIEFVDIAGLVKGASTGEGLGNKFLANIRECDAIGHVIRVFNDPNVIHVHGSVSPREDRDVIETELLIADIQTLEKRVDKAASEAKSGDKDKRKYLEIVSKILEQLNSGKLAIDIELDEKELESIADLHLLTMKPNLYIINLSEDEIAGLDVSAYAEQLGVEDQSKVIPICAKVEQDLSDFEEEEAEQYLQELGLKESGLNALIKSAYSTLGLITYFTSGPKETRAWTVELNSTAPQAAGKIHTDFEKGFIKAEVINWEDFVNSGGEAGAKEKGKMRLEGKEYIVRDGDTMHFKFAN